MSSPPTNPDADLPPLNDDVPFGDYTPEPEPRSNTPLQRAMRSCRGCGWTVRPLGGDRFRVSQAGDRREMSRLELLEFAGISE
jgi:hypothetical protein